MSRPAVTIVSPTLAGNALFRADVLRRLLTHDFDVQVIGFGEPSKIYEPLADVVEFQQADLVHSTTILRARALAARVDNAIRGDAIVCVKPLMQSYGLSLLACRRTPRPIILDIDDWELGFLTQSPYWEMRHWRHRWLTAIDSPLFTRLLDGFTYRAEARTVSTTLLQGLYGGHWIPHTRSSASWPAGDQPPRQPPRVLFAGAPRGHKGLPTLIDAWKRVVHPTAVLELVVPNPADEMLCRLGVHSMARVKVSGPLPFSRMPAVQRAATVVVVPQDNTSGSVGQLPAKLLDAMAVGRAIVASDVGDAARWLSDGAGMVIPPGSPGALAGAIDDLLSRPEDAAEMGCRARARFLALGSEEAVRPRMVSLVRAVIARTPLPAPAPAFAVDDDTEPTLQRSAARPARCQGALTPA